MPKKISYAEMTIDHISYEIQELINENYQTLLSIPGVYEALREHWNNEILSAWAERHPELSVYFDLRPGDVIDEDDLPPDFTADICPDSADVGMAVEKYANLDTVVVRQEYWDYLREYLACRGPWSTKDLQDYKKNIRRLILLIAMEIDRNGEFLFADHDDAARLPC